MTHPVPCSQTEADRLARIDREKAIIANAEREIDAGFGIDDDGLERRFDAPDEDDNTPLPASRKSPAFR